MKKTKSMTILVILLVATIVLGTAMGTSSFAFASEMIHDVDSQNEVNNFIDKTVSTAPAAAVGGEWSYPTIAIAIEDAFDNTVPGADGSVDKPYIISTPQHLANFSYLVNNGTNFNGKYRAHHH